jgi:tRNA uridine 5-carboxymethylaminomethyl modification enzyme
MKRILEAEENLELKQGTVTRIEVGGGGVQGVVTREGLFFAGDAVVLTTGTFMRGLIHVGMQHYSGGRAGEPASEGLSDCLRDLGLAVGRFKTGTPARLSARSIDFSMLEKQGGDMGPRGFSFKRQCAGLDQLCCHIAKTNEKTHQVIRENLHLSPLYSGVIEGIGPRYCPSIEDKVVRFPERTSHQTFLEPDGTESMEIYPSGMSTSLPPEVQLAYFRTMVGLSQVEIMRPGYAIEYDFVEPVQLKKSLEVKTVPGLFHAGQVNGTSGYEEAAAQGLIAGVNAAHRVKGIAPLVLARSQAYIGVMIDDLTTQPTTEPYRMFTSRAEYRLLLREDNADQRLTPLAHAAGLIDEERWEIFTRKMELLRDAEHKLKANRFTPKQVIALNLPEVTSIHNGGSFTDLLRRPQINMSHIVQLDPNFTQFPSEVIEQLEISVKYEGYLKRQAEQVERLEGLENQKLPENFDYSQVQSISREVVEKLTRIRPETLGQAGRIQGVTPAALAVLSIFLKKCKKA